MTRRDFLRRRQPVLIAKLDRPIEHVEYDAPNDSILVLTDQGAHRIDLPEELKR